MKTILALAVGPRRDASIKSKADASSGNVRPYIAGLIAGLEAQGRRPGTDFVIDYRQFEPEPLRDGKVVADACKAQADKSQADLIFAMSTTALQGARCQGVGNTPIVFPSVSDYKGDKVDLGGCATGVSAKRSQTAGECFERFFDTVPTLKEVRVLHKEGYPPSNRALDLVKAAAQKRNVTVTPISVNSPADVATALSSLPARDPAAPATVGIQVLPVDICFSAAPTIVDLATQKKLPVFFPVTDWVKPSLPSALGGYGVPQYTCGELAAEHVNRILWKEESPKNVEVKDAPASAFKWVVSRSAAKALNIPIPTGLRAELVGD